MPNSWDLPTYPITPSPEVPVPEASVLDMPGDASEITEAQVAHDPLSPELFTAQLNREVSPTLEGALRFIYESFKSAESFDTWKNPLTSDGFVDEYSGELTEDDDNTLKFYIELIKLKAERKESPYPASREVAHQALVLVGRDLRG
jgi:hypothetical protein